MQNQYPRHEGHSLGDCGGHNAYPCASVSPCGYVVYKQYNLGIITGQIQDVNPRV